MKTFIVDSFTSRPFQGNPAGVCLPDTSSRSGALPESTMLEVAQELNLSETAFVQPIPDTDRFHIRYFSPKMEIPLCGHATLASAKVLLRDSTGSFVRFVTEAGVELTASRVGNRIAMDFPRYETEPSNAPPAMLDALGLSGVSKVLHAAINRELKILLLEIEKPEVLPRLKPDFPALLRTHDSIHGVVVTSRAPKAIGADFDFQSRYFWPWSGTDEDPVTGGTHTFLSPYWAERLGKHKLRAFQASARTGSLDLSLKDDGLIIEADAVIVLEGRMSIDGKLL